LYFAIFKSIIENGNIIALVLVAFAFIYYIISGVRRLIAFNLNTSEEVSKYFIGIPTPLGAIFLWGVYLLFVFMPTINFYIFISLIVLIAYLLNSKIKIRHP
jgi:CDP-diacylglycerol--serine O-phosphatidyltransferase